MKLLLDTHALLWWLDDHPALSPEARQAIASPRSEVFASAVTAWEIVIKKRLGKLKMPSGLDRELLSQRIAVLPITFEHALAIDRLPDHHEDPFDRMLVAQAMVEGMTLVTRDRDIQKYSVAIIEA